MELKIKRLSPEEIKAFRLRHGILQRDLAKKMAVDPSQISRWEKGSQTIPIWATKMIECIDTKLKTKATKKKGVK